MDDNFETFIVFMAGVLVGCAFLLMIVLPSYTEIGCEYVGSQLEKETSLMDDGACLVEAEHGFLPLVNYLGEK